jgi:hypothetical protein
MKALKIVLALFLCLGSSQSQTNLFAIDETLYTYGEVIRISPESILIQEFDYVTGEEKEEEYLIDSTTVFDVIISAEQIRPSDLVDIEFIIIEDGTKIAREILVDRIEGYQEE